MKKAFWSAILLIVIFTLPTEAQRLTLWRDLHPAVKDSIRESGGNLADTTFLTTWQDVDSLIAASHKQIVLKLNASSYVWNRTVDRNSVTLTDAGADTVYFYLPAWSERGYEQVAVDSVIFLVNGDAVSSIDSVKAIIFNGSTEAAFSENVTGDTPGSSVDVVNLGMTPIAPGDTNSQIQLQVFLTIDTELIFHSIRVFLTMSE